MNTRYKDNARVVTVTKAIVILLSYFIITYNRYIYLKHYASILYVIYKVPISYESIVYFFLNIMKIKIICRNVLFFIFIYHFVSEIIRIFN